MKLKYILSVFLAVLSALPCLGKADTTYFDYNWHKSDFSSADFYRVIEQIDKKKWKVEDHYINDKLQMTGYFTSSDLNVKDGYFIYYDEKGRKITEGNYVKNSREGVFINYHSSNGGKSKVRKYLNDKLEGADISYYESGNISSEEVYWADVKIGEWKDYYDSVVSTLWCVSRYERGEVSSRKSYYKDGKLKREELHNGKKTTGKCYDRDGKEIPFTQFEIMPKPIYNMPDYLATSMKYPEYGRVNNIEGRVIVKFVIEKDGSISDVTAVRKIGGGCDEEAVRVVKAMPKWSPGIQDDEMVKVYFTLPIQFSLQ